MERLRKRQAGGVLVRAVLALSASWLLLPQAAPAQPAPATTPGAQTKTLLSAKFAASTTLPAEIQALKARLGARRALRQKPTSASLIDKIRNASAGPQKIAEAAARGALFSGAAASAASSFSISLTPETPESPYVSAFFAIGAISPWCNDPDLSLGYWTSVGGTEIASPSLSLYFEVPADGWYILNVEATGTKASWKSHSSSGSVSTVETFNYEGRGGVQSYPALVELAAGSHHFYWVSTSSSTTFVSVYEVDVLPASF